MDLEFRRERKAERQKFSNHSFAASFFPSIFRNDYINYNYLAQKHTNFDGEEKTQKRSWLAKNLQQKGLKTPFLACFSKNLPGAYKF